MTLRTTLTWFRATLTGRAPPAFVSAAALGACAIALGGCAVDLPDEMVSSARSAMPRAAPWEVELSAAHLESIGAVLHANVLSDRLAGAVVGVARDGQLVYLAAVGSQDIEQKERMRPESVFRIYSMTKAVTAVAVMMLQEEGAFGLDDPVAQYLPEFANVVVLEADGSTRPPTRAPTVRDLLFHTAGLSHRSSPEYREAAVRSRAITLEQFVTNITAVPLRSDPGTRFRYSASPTVLGRLVEVWSGQTFDAFVTARIIEPLGMIDTGFQVRADQIDRFAQMYRSLDGGGLEAYAIEDVPFTERPALMEGAVGLVSTVPDFIRFAQMLLDGGSFQGTRFLTEESATFLTTNGIPDELLPIYGEGHGWGAASVSVVMDAEAASGDVFEGEYHWDGSAGTEFWVDPTSRTVLVTAWQNNPANPGQVRQQIRQILRDAIRTGAATR